MDPACPAEETSGILTHRVLPGTLPLPFLSLSEAHRASWDLPTLLSLSPPPVKDMNFPVGTLRMEQLSSTLPHILPAKRLRQCWSRVLCEAVRGTLEHSVRR